MVIILQDSEILCWDLRNVGTVLYSMRRCINTHQRVYFDVSCDGHYLASGSDDGFIHIWDLTRENVENGVFPPTKSYLAHVNGTNGSRYINIYLMGFFYARLATFLL